MAILDILTAWPKRPCTYTWRPNRLSVWWATTAPTILCKSGQAMNRKEQERKAATRKGNALSISNGYDAEGTMRITTHNTNDNASEGDAAHDEEGAEMPICAFERHAPARSFDHPIASAPACSHRESTDSPKVAACSSQIPTYRCGGAWPKHRATQKRAPRFVAPTACSRGEQGPKPRHLTNS